MDWSLLIKAIFGAPPPSWTWYDIVRDFVLPLLIGVVGFGGVMLTLSANARLARKQHDREISLRRRVIKNGLLAEFSHAKEVLKDNLKILEDIGPNNEFSIQRLPPRVTIVNSTADLGLLEDSKISSVFDGLMAIERYRTRLLSACEDGAETTDHLVSISRSLTLISAEFAASTIRLIDVSIQSLNGTGSLERVLHSANA